jgi:hypothetical protein
MVLKVFEKVEVSMFGRKELIKVNGGGQLGFVPVFDDYEAALEMADGNDALVKEVTYILKAVSDE